MASNMSMQPKGAPAKEHLVNRAGSLFTVTVLGLVMSVVGFGLSWYVGFGAFNELVVLGPADVVINHDSRIRPLKYEFTLYNPTRHPITIRSVRSGCACVTTRL